MNTAASIEYRPLSGAMRIVSTLDDKIEVRSKVPIYDMSRIDVQKSKFHLTNKQQYVFNKVLKSPQGKLILKEMRSIKVQELISTFVEGYKKEVGVSPHRILPNFIDDVQKEPLSYNCYLNHNIITISKADLYNQFIKQGLIKF